MNKDVSNFCRWTNKNLVAILEGYTRISSNNCCNKWINLNNIEKKMVATWVLCLLGSKVCLQCSADHLLVCVQRLFGFFHWLSSSPRACLFGFIRLFFCFIRCLFGSTRSLLSCIRWLLASARWLFTSGRCRCGVCFLSESLFEEFNDRLSKDKDDADQKAYPERRKKKTF